MSSFTDITGINVDELTKVDPFRDNVSTAGFIIWLAFFGMIVSLVVFTFAYSTCKCCLGCFTCLCCGKKKGKEN